MGSGRRAGESRDAFEREASRALWRGRLKASLYGLGAVMGLVVVVTVIHALFFGRPVDPRVLATGDVRLIAAARDGRVIVVDQTAATPAAWLPNDPFAARLRTEGLPTTKLAAVPNSIIDAAQRWVDLLNTANPDAILRYDVDAYGTLYVYPGAGFYELPGCPEHDRARCLDSMTKATDAIARYWRSYLHDAFGAWRSEGRGGGPHFEPGIVIIDPHGEVSRSLGGFTRVLRPPLP